MIFMVPGWFLMVFHGFGCFFCFVFFMVPGWFLMVPGRFSRFFIAIGWFLMVPGRFS